MAIPPLGCGNGQLEWKVVGPLIYRYVKKMNIPVEMYAPYGTPPNQLTSDFLERPVQTELPQTGRASDSRLRYHSLSGEDGQQLCSAIKGCSMSL